MAGKGHRQKKSGRKADKRKAAVKKKTAGFEDGLDISLKEKAENPKAFHLASKGKARVQRARTAEKEQRRLHAPVVDVGSGEPPPYTVLVHGPPGVGKSTLIKCLIKHWTRQNISDIIGPVTVVSSKKRRVTLIECPSDLCAMIDASKFADLVLLVIDAEFGFEMETFEFLMLLQQHGMPKVMGVLTHLDGFKENKKQKNVKKALKHRFETEVAHGAKLFYLSGIKYGRYLKREVLNLARFISQAKTKPLAWRITHPYLIADRFEDLTPREDVRLNPKCDRSIAVFGFLRGCNLRLGQRVHVAGVDDFDVQDVEQCPDPCPLPDTIKQRSLNERERLIYAPMSNVGGLLYDRDATYIDVPDWKVQYSKPGVAATGDVDEGEAMVQQLQNPQAAVDEQLQASQIQLFSGGRSIRGNEAGHDDDEDIDDDGDSSEGDASSDGDSEADGSEDDSDEDEAGDPSESGLLPHGMPADQRVVRTSDGRTRRAAVFSFAVSLGNDEDDEEGRDDGLVRRSIALERAAGGHPGAEDEEDDDDGDDGENTARWRERMLAKQASLFSTRASDLRRFIYSETAVVDAKRRDRVSDATLASHADSDSEGSDDDFFRPKGAASALPERDGRGGASVAPDVDTVDTSVVRCTDYDALLRRWLPSGPENDDDDDAPGGADSGAMEALARLRKRFVTGGASAFEQERQRALARGEGEYGSDGDNADADELFGDFEDMETGERFEGSGDAATQAAIAAIRATDEEERLEAIRAKKAAKKAAFDAEYDAGGAKNVSDGPARELGSDDEDNSGGDADDALDDDDDGAQPGGRVKKKGKGWARGKEEETYFDHLKAELAERQADTRGELDAMDIHTRVTLEGYRPGAYLRICISNVPCELVENFDPKTPLLIGGLVQGDDKVGYMHLRFKRHRWYPKLLKCRDPLVFSAGWRRFQSVPVYSVEDNNQRQRMLKYTPEHMHCRATIWGPLSPPQTGMIAIQNLSNALSTWRISATAVVMEVDAKFNIMKKLKLVGYPYRIERHTAFIKDMFTSPVEVAKFIGASIRTVSGIRGTVKKAMRPGQAGASAGSFRATFEDKLLKSDIVMLKAWVGVDVPKFFNPVTNLLARAVRLPRAEKTRFVHKRGDDAALDAFAVQAADDAEHAADGAAVIADAVLSQLEPYLRADRFRGPKAGYKFSKGPLGLGYYVDPGPNTGYAAVALRARDGAGAPVPASDGAVYDVSQAPEQPGGETGWTGMRTVAQLRRESGVGAPREKDSLYREIDRVPRIFPAMKVPKTLQAALPYSSKPKVEAPRTRKTLEQKRAVVLEKDEKRAVTLVQQLNAIRNERAAKRREQKARSLVARDKKVAAEQAWRDQYNKEERKRRYQQQTAEANRAAKKARMD